MQFRPRTSTSNRPSSMPCPNCHKLISIQSEQCIHCGYRWPRFYTRLPILGDLIRERLSFSSHILLACLVLYGLALLLDLPASLQMGGVFSMLSPSNITLYKLGMGGAAPWAFGRWWTVITANYLHGSLLHILFNLLWLRQLGPLVESLFGSSRFLVIYTFAGAAGSIVSIIAGTPLFVGASGAIFGLFGALLFYGWRRGGTFGSGLFRQMLLWAAIGFAFGLLAPGIDNWGHLGGFAGGLLAAVVLGYQERSRARLWHHMAAFAAILVIVLCFVMMFAYFFRPI